VHHVSLFFSSSLIICKQKIIKRQSNWTSIYNLVTLFLMFISPFLI
jgi:hypothetical protein